MKSQSSARRPTPDMILAAAGSHIPDLIAPNLTVLFCGINPGLYSAAMKRHFARPGNRFWPALHLGGFTPRILTPDESSVLLEEGYGITSLVSRATATARELASVELVNGRYKLTRKVRDYRPRWVAVLGVQAYRTAFRRPNAQIGQQPEMLARAGLWLLPSPSGANGTHPLVNLVGKLREFHDVVC